MATNMLLGGKTSKPAQQSGGLGGLTGSLLGGGGGGGHGSQGGGSGGPGALVGKLAGSLLGGGSKPHQSSGQTAPSTAGGHQPAGFTGLAAGLLGGHHGSVNHHTPDPLRTDMIQG